MDTGPWDQDIHQLLAAKDAEIERLEKEKMDARERIERGLLDPVAALEEKDAEIERLRALLAVPVWEVVVSDGTALSGGVIDRVLVRASSEADALRIGRPYLNGAGWPEYAAKKRALRGEGE